MSDSQFIMDDVKLLFGDLTTPEAGVKFTPPLRANPATIQGKINPPAITWTWADEATRQAQPVTHDDIGKYGLQSDINVLFQLTSMTPLVWQPAQTVTPDDVGKIGIQTDINTLSRPAGGISGRGIEDRARRRRAVGNRWRSGGRTRPSDHRPSPEIDDEHFFGLCRLVSSTIHV